MDTLVKLATIISPLVSAGVAIWAILVAKTTISESKEIAQNHCRYGLSGIFATSHGVPAVFERLQCGL